MKNIFKMMGIALMACSLMVACNKDDDNSTDNPNPNPPTPTATLNITWDGAAQTLGFKDAYQSSQNAKAFYIDAAKGLNGDTYEYPYFAISFWNSDDHGFLIAGQFTFSTGDGQRVSGQSAFPTEVYVGNGYSVGETKYGEYQWAWCNSENYSSFDATSLTANVNVNMTFYEFATFASIISNMTEEEIQAMSDQEYMDLVESADSKKMDLVLASYPFTAASAK